MDFRRVRLADWILAASGALLLASLFLPWYGASEGASGSSGWTVYAPLATSTLSGFEALSVLDIVLAPIAAAAVAVVPITASQRVPAVPIAFDSLVALAGLVALVLVAIRTLDLPDFASSREWGLWLGLAAAAGIVAGGLAAMKDERGGTPQPSREVERLPTPEAPA